MTKLQESAYNAQLAAGLPVSGLADSMLLSDGDGVIGREHCASYIRAVQQMSWFTAAFPAHSGPLIVEVGLGRSHAYAVTRRITIRANNRSDVGACEQACLLLPDIQDEHGGVTHDEHSVTGIPGAWEPAGAHGGGGMLTVARHAPRVSRGCSR